MRKLFILIVLCLLGFSSSNAQVTFRPGLRGGINFAHFTKGDSYYDYNTNTRVVDNFTAKTDFHIGFYGALHLSKYYTLQPEIDYSRQGTKLESQKYDVSYLSIAAVNKFYFNEKFNVHLGPTIDFVVDKSTNINPKSDVDLAFLLGMGLNFNKNFGIEARIKKGIVPVVDNQSNHTNVVISLGATYTFDL
ncbi:outer membrane beta-barrel protein [Flavobacterium aciduliphilum]|nr:outer membrane beta-barrel protein [Flavobacterium aciduliphilum]